MELLLKISAMKRAGARKVVAILPYMAYSRQTETGDGRSRRSYAAAEIARMMESMGCDMVVTLSFHTKEVKGFFSMNCPLLNIDLTELCVPFFVRRKMHEPVLIAVNARPRNLL